MWSLSRLQMLRGLLTFNLALFIAIIVDALWRAKSSDGTLTTSEIVLLIVFGAGLIAYATGLAGLWFGRRWGPVAFALFYLVAIALDEPGETTRLALVLGDLHMLSGGLILGLAAFGLQRSGFRAVEDVFS